MGEPGAAAGGNSCQRCEASRDGVTNPMFLISVIVKPTRSLYRPITADGFYQVTYFDGFLGNTLVKSDVVVICGAIGW